MFITEYDQMYQIAISHHQELLQEAASMRLVRQVLAGKPKNNPPYYRLLAWLGTYMIAWGRSLQQRYGRMNEKPALVSVEQCC